MLKRGYCIEKEARTPNLEIEILKGGSYAVTEWETLNKALREEKSVLEQKKNNQGEIRIH